MPYLDDDATAFQVCPDCHTQTGEHDAGCPSALEQEIAEYETWRAKRLTVRSVQRTITALGLPAQHVPVGTGRIRSREEDR